MASNIDQQFVEYVVKSLVSHPDAVQVDRSVDEKGVLLELTVDPEDLGRVIGKRGATAQSLRTLLRALGTKNEARYNLKIIDNGSPKPAASTPQATSDDNSAAADEVQNVEPEVDEVEATVKEEAKPAEEEQDDLAAKTRKELAELDDLDV